MLVHHLLVAALATAIVLPSTALAAEVVPPAPPPLSRAPDVPADVMRAVRDPAVPASAEVRSAPWTMALSSPLVDTSDTGPRRADALLVGGADEPTGAATGGGDADLAKQLSNPVASLISVPIQFNFDQGYGPRDDGSVVRVNVQPVIPISLDCRWNLISRTILPILRQRDMFPGDDGVLGLGDTVQSLFLSPKEPTSAGLIWGAGPVFLLPTATDERLGGEQWGAGPTVVGLVQKKGWTFGFLGNHIWSFAGADDRADVNATFLQPFVSYTTKDAWTFTVNTESTYDWDASRWSVPLNLVVSKLVKIGCQPVSVGVGARYWAESPEGGPEGFGLRLVVTFLFPKK